MDNLTTENAEGAKEEKRDNCYISNFDWERTLWKLDLLKLS